MVIRGGADSAPRSDLEQELKSVKAVKVPHRHAALRALTVARQRLRNIDLLLCPEG